MTTTVTIDDDTKRLALEIARLTGKPVEVVLRDAVASAAAATGALSPRRRATDMNKVRAILARVDALPVRDKRTADEIIGYDEFGAPR